VTGTRQRSFTQTENYVSSVDDVWGYSSPTETQLTEDGSLGGSRELSNLLSGISNVRSLAVTDVRDFWQLDKLVRATPELETIVFSNSFGYLVSFSSHPRMMILTDFSCFYLIGFPSRTTH